MSDKPDFDRMTKDEIIAWFDAAENISPLLTSMTPATEAVARPVVESPMMLASIRLPVLLVEQVDSLADLQGIRRSDVIRNALVAYVAEQTSPVGRADAEHALDVLRKVVADRMEGGSKDFRGLLLGPDPRRQRRCWSATGASGPGRAGFLDQCANAVKDG